MDTDQLFDQAATHYTYGEYEKAASIFERLLTHQHSQAATYYAELFQHGEGVTQDIERAERLLLMGIEWGDSNAAYNLAAMYWSGAFGLTRDRIKAKQYFQLAKEMGCTLNVEPFIGDNDR